MILKEQLNAEIKIGKIVKKDDIFIIEEYDKDGNLIIILFILLPFVFVS